MCGLFGFTGTRHNRGTLALAAAMAARRGPDGWGMLVDGRRHANVGPLTASAVETVPLARLVLGHCRLATVLGTKTVEACQPITVGGWAVAHNGTVANVAQLQARHGFALRTGVDSEAIAHLVDKLGDLDAAMAEVDHGGHFAVAAVELNTARVELRAHGLPLWRLRAAEGEYWCSLQAGPKWEPIA